MWKYNINIQYNTLYSYDIGNSIIYCKICNIMVNDNLARFKKKNVFFCSVVMNNNNNAHII